MNPKISAIVCTRNRCALLGGCLEGIRRQTLPMAEFEVIVVDNGSTDDTPAVAKKGAETMPLVYVHEPVVGLSQARNTGLSFVKSPRVAFLDDDAVPDEGWLAAAVGVFASVEPTPVWAGGPVAPEYETPRPSWLDPVMEGYLSVVDFGMEARWLEPHEHLCGTNSAFDHRVLRELGSFDTRLGRTHTCLISGEETELEGRIAASGGRRYYHPGMRIRHRVPAERLRPEWLYRRAYWGGVSDFVIARIAKTPPVPAPSGGENLFSRAARHLRWAGFGASPNHRIRGRIYLAYALGRMAGRFHARGRTT